MNCNICGRWLTQKHKCPNNPVNLAEKNGMWRGDQVKLDGLHLWVRSRLPKPVLCQDCQKVPPYDLANISQEYKRDLDDWEWLCRRCHMKKDGRLDRLNLGRHKPRPIRYCKEKDCFNKHYAKDMCQKHYNYKFIREYYQGTKEHQIEYSQQYRIKMALKV